MPEKNEGFGNQDCGDDPTPAEIRKGCLEIQAGWSESEKTVHRSLPDRNKRPEVAVIATPRNQLGQKMA